MSPVPRPVREITFDSLAAELHKAPPGVREQIKLQAKHDLWRRGDLAWKLDKTQREGYDILTKAPPRRTVVWEWARKNGKSYTLWVIALEAALKNPGKRINYAGPTGKEALELSLPIVKEISADAPDDCMPVWNGQKSHFELPNGAYVVLFGCDDKHSADRGRGPQSILNIVDEAGFIGILAYVIRSVLAPQTIRTRGRTVIASTPPETPDHDFCRMADAAKAGGLYLHKTIFQNGMMSAEEVDEYIAAEAANAGMTVAEFKNSSDYKREFLAERVTDEKLAVIPEWHRTRPDGTKLFQHIVKEIPRPRFFDHYEAIDFGFKDPTGVLFGYFHKALRAIVVEDELLFTQTHEKNSQSYADGIRFKEKALWPLTMPMPRDGCSEGTSVKYNRPVRHEAWEPMIRIADGGGLGLQIIQDMQVLHGLSLMPTDKTELDIMVDNLRLLFRRVRVFIHPRCVNLITQLSNTIWNNMRTEFLRTASGHGDLLMCLVYWARNVRFDSEPTPEDFGFDPANQEKNTHYVQEPQSWEMPDNTGIENILLNMIPNAWRDFD